MDTKNEIKLCELSTSLDDAWRKLYESSFPADERETEDKLSKLMSAGTLLYHRTLNAQGELLVFTMVSITPEYSFLAYMATDPTKRSGGYGSKHLKRLIELLKEQYPHHLCMCLEIEATNPTTLTISDDEKKLRQRRLAFYERLGARRTCKGCIYLTPSRLKGNKDWEGELLAIEFNERMCRHELMAIISDIFQRLYCLEENHPLLTKLMQCIKVCKTAGCHADDCCKRARLMAPPAPTPPPVVSECTSTGIKSAAPAKEQQKSAPATPPAQPADTTAVSGSIKS